MDKLESDFVLQLKSCFFNMIEEEPDKLAFEAATFQMLIAVRNLLHAEEVTLYRYDEWKQQFRYKGTAGVKKEAPLPNFILFENLELLSGFEDVHSNSDISLLFPDYDYLVKLKAGTRQLGFILLRHGMEDGQQDLFSKFFSTVGRECSLFLEKAYSLEKIIIEEKRYRRLFNITEKFHSTMDMDIVLGEIIATLQEIYPGFSYYLLLSQDSHNHGQLPIKDLEYDSENIAAMQAYVTGTIQIEDSIQEKKSILYAPLKGKQGVYGVLQVIAPNTLFFPKNEVEFITQLADTAGSSLENAQLYQQSKRLISDLQLINETSHRLNSNLRLSETINYICGQIINSFQAREVGFFMLSADSRQAQALPGSTDFFLSDESGCYKNYLLEKIQKEADSLFIGDLVIPGIPADEIRYRSVMAVPMIQSDVLKGFAVVVQEDAYFFSFDTFKLLQSLIHHSTLAFTNSILREELEKMIITDHLTKLHSRNYLDERIQRSMLEDELGTFILIDIDDFKFINDTYGHQIGDEVIIQVANLIKSNIRGSDIGARWGGEELAIYLPRVSLPSGVAIAERLVEKVLESTNPNVTISCGVSYWNRDRGLDSFKFLFKRADEALYYAKNSGKNKVMTQETIIRVR